MSERIAIVTGANNGLGFETTKGLASAGYLVVMACRNLDKAQQAKDVILKEVPDAKLDILQIDVGDFTSVRDFADAYRQKYPHLNLLVNNAGIYDFSGGTTREGYDLQFTTNYLGHFLLTSQLIDLMPDDETSRIISLGSLTHKFAKLHFDNDPPTTVWDKAGAYGQSKLACMMFADELNRRLQKSGKKILSLSAHPGGSATGIFQDFSVLMKFVLWIATPLFIQSVPEGAKPILHAALGEKVMGGQYYGPKGFMEATGAVGLATKSRAMFDRDAAAKLWNLTEALVGQEFIVESAELAHN